MSVLSRTIHLVQYRVYLAFALTRIWITRPVLVLLYITYFGSNQEGSMLTSVMNTVLYSPVKPVPGYHLSDQPISMIVLPGFKHAIFCIIASNSI